MTRHREPQTRPSVSRAARSVLRRTAGDTTVLAALQGGSWALAGTLVGRVANVGVLLLAARALGSEQFGGFSLVLATAGVVTSVSALGLPVAVQKLVAESGAVDRPRQQRLIDVALGVTVLVGALTMAGFYLSGAWIAAGVLGRAELAPLIALAAVLVLLTPCVEMLAGLLAALERFKDVGVFRAVHGCTAAVVLGGVLVVAPGPLAVLGAVAAAELFTCVVGGLMVARARGRRSARAWQAAEWRPEVAPAVGSLLRVSLPAMVASVSLQPALWLGQVLLSRQPDGLEQVGMFAVALRWHAIALFVPATMGSVLLPMLGRLRASGRDSDARTLFVRYGGLTLAFSTLTCVVLIMIAAPLMGLQGQEYLGAAPVLAVLAVSIVPTAVNNVLSQRALAEGRLALWVWSDLVLAATMVVAALMLVPVLNGTGLAWSYLLAYAATCAVLLPVALAARTRVVPS